MHLRIHFRYICRCIFKLFFDKNEMDPWFSKNEVISNMFEDKYPKIHRIILDFHIFESNTKLLNSYGSRGYRVKIV